MAKKIKIITLLTVLSLMILPVFAASAQTSPNLETQQLDILNEIGEQTNYQSASTDAEALQNSLAQKVGNIIKIVLSVTGVIFLFIVVYGGIQWMSSGGNEEKIGRARKKIINAGVGLAIASLSYIITTFVVNVFQ